MNPDWRFSEICVPSAMTEVGIDLIYVYVVHLNNAPVKTRQWETTLRSLTPPNSGLFGYDLDTRLGKGFRWPILLSKSLDLLETLWRFHAISKNTKRRIVFCCHGLAGIVLKQTLHRAGQQFMRFQALIEAVLGIIFLACPHSTRTDEATSRLYSLLQYLDTTDSIRLKISHDDLVSLANASRQF
ncbi:hypothetical protein V8E51_003725 [Hyaloscypha variabilis]